MTNLNNMNEKNLKIAEISNDESIDYIQIIEKEKVEEEEKLFFGELIKPKNSYENVKQIQIDEIREVEDIKNNLKKLSIREPNSMKNGKNVKLVKHYQLKDSKKLKLEQKNLNNKFSSLSIKNKEITKNCKNDEKIIKKYDKLDFDKFSNNSLSSLLNNNQPVFNEDENPFSNQTFNKDIASIIKTQFKTSDLEIPIYNKFSIYLPNIEHFLINDRHVIAINETNMMIYKYKVTKSETNNYLKKMLKRMSNFLHPAKEKKRFLKLKIYKTIPSSYFLFLLKTKKISDKVVNFSLMIYQCLLILKIRRIDKIFDSFLRYLNVEKIYSIEYFLIKNQIFFLIEYANTTILLDSNFKNTNISEDIYEYKKYEQLKSQEISEKCFTNKKDTHKILKDSEIYSLLENKYEFIFSDQQIEKVFLNQNLNVCQDNFYKIQLKNSDLIIDNEKVNIYKKGNLGCIKSFNFRSSLNKLANSQESEFSKVIKISKYRNLFFIIFKDKITCINLSKYDTKEEILSLD